MGGSASRSSFLLEHDLFGKPDSTFPDHALGAVRHSAVSFKGSSPWSAIQIGGRLRVDRLSPEQTPASAKLRRHRFERATLIAIECNAGATTVPSRSAERARQGRVDICRSEKARDRLQCGRYQRRRRVHRSAWHRGHSGAVHPQSWRRQEILPDRLAEGPAHRRIVLITPVCCLSEPARSDK